MEERDGREWDEMKIMGWDGGKGVEGERRKRGRGKERRKRAEGYVFLIFVSFMVF